MEAPYPPPGTSALAFRLYIEANSVKRNQERTAEGREAPCSFQAEANLCQSLQIWANLGKSGQIYANLD